MFLQIIILCFGLFLLYTGSTILIKAASSTAVMFAIRPVIIGLTIVSFATSAPELLVSLIAAFKGSQGISIGNILGSNAINIALVLGLSAIIKPFNIQKQIIKIEIPYMIIVSIIFWLVCMDSKLGRLDGIFLLFLLLVFLIYGVMTAKDKNANKNFKPSLLKIFKHSCLIILGIIMISYGADCIVQQAINLANKIGLSQTFIGISIVALGTSLPELAASAVAASRNEGDICIGNVVGSNLFNICLVMGTIGFLHPMTIDKNLHIFQFPFMIFICVALGIISYLQHQISRKTGFCFITIFCFYIIISYWI